MDHSTSDRRRRRVLTASTSVLGCGPRSPVATALGRNTGSEWRAWRLGSPSARLDLENYTRNVLLRDTDAMSMAHSLKVRVPYLDHELVEWALTLPDNLVVGRGKALLVERRGPSSLKRSRAAASTGSRFPWRNG